MFIVTASDGRPTTGVIEESMLSPEILAKTLLLNYTGLENDTMTSEARVRRPTSPSSRLPTGTAEQQWMLNFC
jgi:hypothetical protein